MSDSQTQTIVVGAGVIGCSVALRLAEAGHQVLVLERGPRPGEGVTSRNSGVIHSGLYYAPGSLKAECCIEGQALLYEWCIDQGVAHQKTGKWVIAQHDELSDLDLLDTNARNSGAKDLHRLTRTKIEELAPLLNGEEALFAGLTGIVDPAALCRSFESVAFGLGAEFLYHVNVQSVERTQSKSWILHTSRGDIAAELWINCAGLQADEFLTDSQKVYPWRGDYFRIKSSAHYPALVYPVKKASAPGLGVHLTRSLEGGFRLGPDAYHAASKEDFKDLPPGTALESKRLAFFESARRYLKGITLDQLEYDTCGIRPKLRSPSDRSELDFAIRCVDSSYVELNGIESPGLTSSLSLARRVVSLLR